MPGLIIRKALFGIGNVHAQQTNVVDVTDAVQELANTQGNSVQFTVDGQTFGLSNDPAPGVKKSFTVEYVSQTGHTILVRGGSDGDEITLQNGHPVEILSAVYGGAAYGVDITKKLSEYFDDPGAPTLTLDGNFSIRFCGVPDISPGIVKGLSITMKYLGETRYLMCHDGDTISRKNDGNTSIIVCNEKS